MEYLPKFYKEESNTCTFRIDLNAGGISEKFRVGQRWLKKDWQVISILDSDNLSRAVAVEYSFFLPPLDWLNKNKVATIKIEKGFAPFTTIIKYFHKNEYQIHKTYEQKN